MKERIVPVASDPPRMPLPATPSTPSMPFFERFKSRVPTAADADIPPQSPQKELGKEKVESDEESEFEGLAYADSDSDDGDGDEDTQKKDGREGRILAVSPTSPTSERVRFPSVSSVATLSDMKTESRYSRETVQPLRVRSSSSSTSTSTSTSSSSGSGSRKSLNGIGASGENRKSSSGIGGEKRQSRKEKRQTIRMTGRGLDLAMATLLEEEGSVSGRGSMNVGNLGGGGSLGGRGSMRGSVSGRGSVNGNGNERGSVEVVPPLPSVRGPSTSESNIAINDGRGGGGGGGVSERDSMRPKLPTRAKTTPSTSPSSTSPSSTATPTSSTGHSNGSGGGATTKRRATDASSRRKGGTHTCLKCGGWIEDGRWIRMEGAGVMCDRCWKGMYLPKVSFFAGFLFSVGFVLLS